MRSIDERLPIIIQLVALGEALNSIADSGPSSDQSFNRWDSLMSCRSRCWGILGYTAPLVREANAGDFGE
jgi:hypothetical protein